MKISPSVLACDFSRLGEEALAMQHAGADFLHLDIMDGHFVPNITFGAPVIKKLKPHISIPLDTHLMISDPLRYVPDFAAAGADILTFHMEADSPVQETIDAIKAHGMLPGLVVKPMTPVQVVLPYLEEIAMVLIMTVEPGFGGQAFMEEMLPKIAMLRDFAESHRLPLDIEVDGGIDEATVRRAAGAGANVFVAGSFLYGQSDYRAAVDGLRKAALAG